MTYVFCACTLQMINKRGWELVGKVKRKSNNWLASSFFKPERGISYGCPLSALLFLLVVEVLAISIKNNHWVSGIKIGKTDYKITQLADSTPLFIADIESLRIFLFVLEIFRQWAGLKINPDNSEAIWIGASSNFRHNPCGLNWTDGMVRCWRIWIGTVWHEQSNWGKFWWTNKKTNKSAYVGRKITYLKR